jgi:hypothetical protein
MMHVTRLAKDEAKHCQQSPYMHGVWVRIELCT